MKTVASSVLVLACVAVSGQVASAETGPRIMVVGDSITWGMTVPTNTPGGYRTNFYQTLNSLNQKFLFVGSYTENPSDVLTAAGQTAHDGQGGWTVATDVYDAMNNFNYHIDDWMQSSNPDIVTVLGGINDLLLLQGAKNFSATEAVSHTIGSTDLMLSKIFADKPKVQVFLSSLIPTAGSNAWTNPTVITYNSQLRNTLVPKYQNLGYNIHFVDQYSNFTTTGGAVDGTHLSDGLHPDATGYHLMGATFGNAVAPVAKSLNLRAAPIIVDLGCNPDSGGTNRKSTLGGNSIRDNGLWAGTLSNLVGTDGTASDYGFQWVTISSAIFGNTISSSTALSGKAASIFPDSDARNSWGSFDPSTSFTFKLTGLKVGTQYVLDLFGGHEGGTDVTRYVATGLNSLTGDLLTGNNTSNVLTLSGILPNASGEISVTYSAAPGSSLMYLNAIRLNEVAVPEPASLGLLSLGALAILRRHRK